MHKRIGNMKTHTENKLNIEVNPVKREKFNRKTKKKKNNIQNAVAYYKQKSNDVLHLI